MAQRPDRRRVDRSPGWATARRLAVGVAAGVWAAAACGAEPASSAARVSPASPARPLPAFERVLAVDPPREIADFELTDQRGQTFHTRSLRGAPALVFFGFTHCPDVCPTTLATLAMALRGKEPALASARVVMISADPERDSPDVLARYLSAFDGRFIGLTGTPAAARAAAAAFRAAFFKGQPRAGTTDYVVEHSYQVFVLDREGRLRAELFDAAPAAVAGVLRALHAE